MTLTPEQVQAIVSAVVLLLGTWHGYLQWRVGQNTASIKLHDAALNGPTVARDARISALEAGSGSTARAVPPAYNQLADPLPDGRLPAQRYQECGEEVAAMIVDWKHGVALSADALRAMLNRSDGSALTSGADIVRLLSLCNVRALSVSLVAADVKRRIRDGTGNGRPVAVLVRIAGSSAYHWLCAYSSDDASVHCVDPWGGVRLSLGWDDLMARYAGTIVLVADTPDLKPIP